MSLVHGREPLNPWNFLSGRSVFVTHGGHMELHWIYVNKMTHAGPWIGSGRERKTNSVTRGLQKGKWGWRSSLITCPMIQSVMPTSWYPNKSSGHCSASKLAWLAILSVLSHTDVTVGYHISEDETSFVSGTLPDFVSCISAFISFRFVRFCYNKAVITSIVLPSKLSVLRGSLWGISTL